MSTRFKVLLRNPSHPYCSGGHGHYQGKCATDWNVKDGEWRRTFPRFGVYARVWSPEGSGRWAWTLRHESGGTIGDVSSTLLGAKRAAADAVANQRWVLARGSTPRGSKSNPSRWKSSSRVVRRRKGWCKLANGTWRKDCK